jgi:cationic amino acid transporter 2
MTNFLHRFYDNITRKKTYDTESMHTSQLRRCLTVFDLTILGIGSTLGTGTYILTGQVAHETAGPSVILSFLIAAIASVLAGICYAEFGSRAPRAGSAYTYTYVSVGEIMAFIIGWNMILEYVIGAASTARALSAYFDSLINFSMKKYFAIHFPLHSETFAPYADLFAMTLCLVITILLIIGIKESAVLNNVFTFVNLTVITLVIIVGLTKINGDNWKISPDEIKNSTNTTYMVGKGGFFPFGIEGTLAGAATCFYAFVGFDLVATTGEESKNPQRAIPMSICLTLLVCSVIYCGVSIVITLMVNKTS